MLLLFDIDGTLLIRAAGAHQQAMHEALREVHGVDVHDKDVPLAGRTDRAIMRSLLMLADVPTKAVDDRMDDCCSAACIAYARLCPEDLSATVAPGVPAALQAVVAAGHTLALVTGNLEPIARLKLRRAGLGEWFSSGPGGFGSDDEDRAALPGLARRRAGGVAREQAVVIGDTPLDIACARADGVRCVAVTTGPHPAHELHEADAVIDGMKELEALLSGWSAPA